MRAVDVCNKKVCVLVCKSWYVCIVYNYPSGSQSTLFSLTGVMLAVLLA